MSSHVATSPVLQKPTQQKLIAVGIFTMVYRLSDTLVRKLPRADDAFSYPGNLQAVSNEASIYALLGESPRIARCLSIGKTLDYVDLEFYPHGTLMSYIQTYKESISDDLRVRWARQIIEAVVLAHEKAVIHSDLALRQFFVDSGLNARLADFGASGFPGQEALGMENTSHCLPRDGDKPNTFESDLFALGSTLYELAVGEAPYCGLEDALIETLYTQEDFPLVDDVFCGCIIIGCWRREFPSAKHVLSQFEESFGHNEYC